MGEAEISAGPEVAAPKPTNKLSAKSFKHMRGEKRKPRSGEAGLSLAEARGDVLRSTQVRRRNSRSGSFCIAKIMGGAGHIPWVLSGLCDVAANSDGHHIFPSRTKLDCNFSKGKKMIALFIFCASLPAMLCVGCAAFLAFKERKQWGWFAGLSVLAGVGGLAVLNMTLWRYLA